MFKNYWVVALRNIGRNKIFSFINAMGLFIGITASLLIFLIVHHANHFDRFEKNGDRIFRVVSDYAFQNEPGHTRGIPGPLADAVKKELSGIDKLVSFRYFSPENISLKNTASEKPTRFKQQQHIIFADAHYFDLLPYHWLAGNKQSASDKENQVVLSESRARLYFPSIPVTEVIGKEIIYDDSILTQVSGVVADLDQQGQTDFNFLEFISLNTILKNSGLQKSMYWNEWNSTTSDQQLYVQLAANATVATTEKQLKNIFEKYQGEDAKKNHYTWTYRLQPLDDIHFNHWYGTFDSPVASKPMLMGLIIAATFLIGIACINFINLTTANAAQRAKEIGVRKTLGSSRKQLVLQFLGETFLVTGLSTILAAMVAPAIGKIFSDFIPEGVSFSVASPFALTFLVIILISVTLLAGFYPAWVLSSSSALEVMKNRAYKGTHQTRTTWLRRGLTVSQFVIAQFFVMGAVMVGKQIHFMMTKDLGFSKEAIISIDYPSSDRKTDHKKYVLAQMTRVAGVSATVMANDLPSSYGWWTSTIDYNDGKKQVKQTVVELKSGSSGYISLLKIPMLAGRDLLPSDTVTEILINETYLHILGFKQPADAVGKTVKWDSKSVPIVGVMKDFHAHPLNYKIGPMGFVRYAEQSRVMLASLSGDQNRWTPTIAEMKKNFMKEYPGEEFKYEFLDASISKAYGDIRQTSSLLKLATGLTVFISCLGLLGLVIYTTTHRTKEIGIRKVLGASVTQLMRQLSGDFLKLVFIAFLIATPVAWWAIHRWLDDFVFRTPVSWWIFASSGIGMIGIALITLSVQTFRAAMANPVKSLTAE